MNLLLAQPALPAGAELVLLSVTSDRAVLNLESILHTCVHVHAKRSLELKRQVLERKTKQEHGSPPSHLL